MSLIPHATFLGSFTPDDEFDHPAGATFARFLQTSLAGKSFLVSDIDNWRDCGWVIYVTLAEKEFEVYFAGYGKGGEPGWLLAVAPLNQPGALGRLFGRKPTLVTSELQTLSLAVHEALCAHPAITKLRWYLGGPPEKTTSFASPGELPWIR